MLALLEKYYPRETPAHGILLAHSLAVAELAARIARRLPESVDLAFVEEAALLHDIGIRATRAPDIGCTGDLPYICHGVEGRKLLDAEGLPRHALVCERHIGVGLSAAEIRAQGLPLPQRDMLPLSLEEQIVTYADLFFSKNPRKAPGPKTPEQVRKSLGRHGAAKVAVFDVWHRRFGL
ncbi:HD domain-containing protein [Geoalkalibacter sp.]|uniref:HD domain-containing protein n=1 Tax=Geoalkalibacter sp. TaxID=3041440 RepID=UPI00272E4AD7|nr:HD domain-containing protein [Geoalkalibacter sp.]